MISTSNNSPNGTTTIVRSIPVFVGGGGRGEGRRGGRGRRINLLYTLYKVGAIPRYGLESFWSEVG